MSPIIGEGRTEVIVPVVAEAVVCMDAWVRLAPDLALNSPWGYLYFLAGHKPRHFRDASHDL